MEFKRRGHLGTGTTRLAERREQEEKKRGGEEMGTFRIGEEGEG